MDRCNETETEIEYTNDGVAIIHEVSDEHARLMRQMIDRQIKVVTVPATQLRIPLAI